MSLKYIVAFSGPAGAGKTTAAGAWARKYGAHPLRFATPLKRIIQNMNPYLSDGRRLHWPLETEGEGYAKENYPEYREYLQELGEGIREWHPEFFATVVEDNLKALHFNEGRPYGVVIDDLRLPVEHRMLRKLSGGTQAPFVHVRVERPDIDELGHHTETALRHVKPDYTLTNDGDVADLTEKLSVIYQEEFSGSE